MTPESPRIAQLSRDLEAGATTPDVFWHEMAENGTPLIEPIDGTDTSLVTFLYRETVPVEEVRVVPPGKPFQREASRLGRLRDTDILYRTFALPNDARIGYRLWRNPPPLDPRTDRFDELQYTMEDFMVDPLNRHPWPEATPFTSMAIMPDAAPEEWIEPNPDLPMGTVEEHPFHSDILDSDRLIRIYTPPGHDADRERAGILLLFDGGAYLRLVPTPTVLDNLLAAGHIPPLIAVLEDPADAQRSMGARLNELVASEEYLRYLTDELLPWVRETFNATDDPARTIVGGSSAGGFASAFAALRRPDVFGNVLSQSGMYYWSPKGEIEPEWLVRQFAETELRAPVRFYLETGTYEYGEIPLAIDESISLRQANRHLRDILRARGFPVIYSEFPGGHDYIWWRGTLAKGLLALM